MISGKPSYLTVDVGTSALKAVLYSSQGEVSASATRRYEVCSVKPGWAETNPEDWWIAFENALADLRLQGFSLMDIVGVAFTGQMHTAVLLNASDKVLEPTILWLDRRAVAETAELVDQFNLPPYQINSTYTLPKLLWLKRHQPEVIQKVHKILWPKDFLRYRLTGELGTDITEAGGAALMNWDDRTWATERLALVGLDPSVLPFSQEADAVVGTPRWEVASKLGLNPKAKVIMGMGDVAALIGGAPPKSGRVVCSLGSSSMVFMALAENQKPHDPAHRLYIYPLGPYRLLGGVSSTTGAALVWAYENVGLSGSPDASFEKEIAKAAGLGVGVDGLCFLPYLAGERTPYWQDDLKSGFFGIQLSHTRYHLIRAVMEGVAFSLRHLLDIYVEMGIRPSELVLAGGGAKTPGLAQMIADVCQYDVSIYSEAETVTRVLYALCHSALAQTDFNDVLINTFPEPKVINYTDCHTDLYQQNYEIYRRFAEFANKEASNPVLMQN